MTARIIILAAQRPGVVNPLAHAHGVSHKCLVPLKGKPLIAHVLTTVTAQPDIASVRVSVEPEVFQALETIFASLGKPADFFACVASANNLADSVSAAAAGHDGPIIVTTADHALLTPDAITAMHDVLSGGADGALAMATQSAVHRVHPDGQRRFYRFADDAYSNCNLYGLSGADSLRAAEIFRSGGQFAKKAKRIVEAFGLINLILLRLRLISLRGGLKRISRRMGLRIEPVILADGRNAIDVDNERTYAVVAGLLK